MDISPVNPPDLGIPSSTKTVRVRAMDTTTRMVCAAGGFVKPVIPGHEELNFKTLCFLVEHEGPSGTTEHVLFDAGTRKDFWNVSPSAQRMIGDIVPALEVDHGVDEILINSGLDLSEMKAVVWSHWHWDHIGDGSKFPASTDIVVGPGFTEAFVPGWPINPESPVMAKDLEGHRVHEPDFPLTIGGFRAHDYFGDGSFYLLDVPGHAIGHICGFARTTPDTFVFMGADCCHFTGMLRPTKYNVLPLTIPAEQLDAYRPRPCPCSVFTTNHPAATASDADAQTRTRPFYEISAEKESAYSFTEMAQKTLASLQLFDANPSIFLCIAHDGVLIDMLPLYNDDPKRDINDWKEKKYHERARWGFLNELPRDNNHRGREALVPGLMRDGKMLSWNERDGFYEI